MKLITVVFASLLGAAALAHEGGHGELEEGGKFGGITAPVVARAEAGRGNSAKVLYKAELVRTESGKLSLYVFDEKMKLVDLAAFGPAVSAKLEVKKKGKFTYVGDFALAPHGNHFMGQLPKIEHKPFNIDLFLERGGQKLFVGFSNLD